MLGSVARFGYNIDRFLFFLNVSKTFEISNFIPGTLFEIVDFLKHTKQ